MCLLGSEKTVLKILRIIAGVFVLQHCPLLSKYIFPERAFYPSTRRSKNLK